MIRSALWGLALAIAAFIFALAPAEAGKPKVGSEITYKNSVEPGAFVHKGRVKSELGRCVRGRVVKLRGEGVDGNFDKTKTGRDGKYRFEMEGDGLVADYYTVTPRKKTKSVICKAAESPHKSLG